MHAIIINFKGLLKDLWDVSFTPKHIIGGFRGSGLFPLSRAAIPPSKLAPSTVFRHVPTAATATATSARAGATATTSGAGATATTSAGAWQQHQLELEHWQQQQELEHWQQPQELQQ